jgi:hypothetical protein
VRQAEQLAYTASSLIRISSGASNSRRRPNVVLLGQYPGRFPRGHALTEQAHLPEVPAGLPLTLLQRRLHTSCRPSNPWRPSTPKCKSLSKRCAHWVVDRSIRSIESRRRAQPIFIAGKLKANLQYAQDARRGRPLTNTSRPYRNLFVRSRTHWWPTGSPRSLARKSPFWRNRPSTDCGSLPCAIKAALPRTWRFLRPRSISRQARHGELQGTVQLYKALGRDRLPIRSRIERRPRWISLASTLVRDQFRTISDSRWR